MEIYIPVIIDVILGLIIVVGICIGYKKGFAGMLVGFLGKIIAFVVACICSKIFTEMICKAIKEPVLNQVVKKLSEFPVASSAGELTQNFLNSLPTALSNIVGFYLPDSVNIQNTTNDIVSSTAAGLTDSVFMPIINLIISSLLFFVLFSVLSIVVKRTAKSMYNIKKVPFVGKVNSFMGALLGFVDGAVIVLVIAFAICVILPFAFGEQIKVYEQNSYILKFLCDINPFVNFKI